VVLAEGDGMATRTTPKMTAEEFFEWANRPENADRWCELDRGEVIDVPPPKHPHGFFCWLASKVLTEYLTRRGDGYICMNDTGIIVERQPDTVRGADLILFLRMKPLDEMSRGYVEDIPALIVEVLSPDDRPGRTNRRIDQYIRRGIPMVWLIDSEERTVTVYRPNEFPKLLDETDTLTGNGILPDFSCPVRDLFALPGQKAPPKPAPKRPRPRKGNRE
jgi:Uma2 family endonuclease